MRRAGGLLGLCACYDVGDGTTSFLTRDPALDHIRPWPWYSHGVATALAAHQVDHNRPKSGGAHCGYESGSGWLACFGSWKSIRSLLVALGLPSAVMARGDNDKMSSSL
jgi:hypothetical protein